MTTTTSNDQLVAEFIEFCDHKRRQSPRTVRTYGYVLALYLGWLNGRPLTSVTIDDVEEFGARQRRVAKASTATIRNNIVIVRCFHSWLIERKGMNVVPLRTVTIPEAPKARPKPLDDDVWRAVWASNLDVTDRMWLGLGYYGGLRRIEVVTIKVEDVRLDLRELWGVRKGGVHSNVEYGAIYDTIADELPHLAEAPHWPELFDEFVQIRQRLGEPTVWAPQRLDVEGECNSLNKRMETISRRLKLPTGALTPHRLRHSCATNLLRCDVELGKIQRQLAHSSINMTQRYLQFSGELARARRERDR